ncbi:MAG: hypothetical protein ACPG52_08690 [Cognaticolwellia sp.]
MSSEAEKGQVEIRIFKRFAAAAGLNFSSVEKQSPEEGKPDLKCRFNGKVIFFELTEACSEDVAKAVAHEQALTESAATNIRDYTSETYQKKINKHYAVTEPVELLIYNIGRTILPDEVLINNIRAIADKNKGQFSKVWYFNKHAVEI